MPTVFISATSRGLKQFRLVAAEQLRAMGIEPIVQDEFPIVHQKIGTMLAAQGVLARAVRGGDNGPGATVGKLDTSL